MSESNNLIRHCLMPSQFCDQISYPQEESVPADIFNNVFIHNQLTDFKNKFFDFWTFRNQDNAVVETVQAPRLVQLAFINATSFFAMCTCFSKIHGINLLRQHITGIMYLDIFSILAISRAVDFNLCFWQHNFTKFQKMLRCDLKILSASNNG